MPPLATLVRRVRQAESLPALADAMIAGLGATPGVVGVAVVGLSSAGAPTLWIGDDGFTPADVQAFLAGSRRDPCEDRRAVAGASIVELPIAGSAQLAGAIRVITCASLPSPAIALLSAVISMRLSALGIDAPLVDHVEPIRLSERQREIAVLVARGCTNAEIAAMVGCTSHAVKKQVSRICLLLDVSNRTELAAIAARWTAGSSAPAIRRPIYRAPKVAP